MTPYFEMVSPTYIENWPNALKRLSIPSADVPLTLEETAALGSNIVELFELFDGPPAQDITSITKRLGEAISRFPRGAFVRLGSRSPKDTFSEESPRSFTAHSALDRLLGASERVAEDLLLALSEGYAPHIWVRQWVDIEPWAEFRCFMEGHRLAGISQYDYNRKFPELTPELLNTIFWLIDRFYNERFKQATHVVPVVFDVFVVGRSHGTETHWDVKLLEINPFCEMTDPCLFDWSQPFDAGLRTL